MSTRSQQAAAWAHDRPWRATSVVLAVALSALLSCDGRERTAGNSAATTPHPSSDVAAVRLAEQMLSAPPATAFSLIELIGNPERFVNGRVNVGGFLEVEKSEFDRTHGFLYLGREDYEARLENLVKIQFEHCAQPQAAEETVSFERAKELSLQYVHVKGFFTPPRAPKGKGLRGPLDFGTICVTSIFPIQQRSK